MLLPYGLPCRYQHILNKDTAPSRGILHKDVSDSTHQFAVLNNRAVG
jgi:hypothetical protein